MFSAFTDLFADKLPPTRFNRCALLAQLPPLLKELHKKVASLKTDADKNGAGSMDFLKYGVMDYLLGSLTTRINQFNKTASSNETVEVLSLVKDMRRIVLAAQEERQYILNTSRNYNQAILDQTLNIGSYALVLATTSALPFANIVSLAALFYIAPNVSDFARNSTGSNNRDTASYALVKQLSQVLKNIGNNIDPRVDWNQSTRTQPTNTSNADPDGCFATLFIRPDTPEELLQDIVKKHYQILALKYHPDRNPSVDKAVFQKILAAYEFLSDDNKRSRYLRHQH